MLLSDQVNCFWRTFSDFYPLRILLLHADPNLNIRAVDCDWPVFKVFGLWGLAGGATDDYYITKGIPYSFTLGRYHRVITIQSHIQ